MTTLLIVNLFTTQEFRASHATAKDHSEFSKTSLEATKLQQLVTDFCTSAISHAQ